MKLHEVLDSNMLARRLDVLNKDKPKSTRTLIKLLRKRADRRNRKTPDTKQIEMPAYHDGMAGYESPKSPKSFIDSLR